MSFLAVVLIVTCGLTVGRCISIVQKTKQERIYSPGGEKIVELVQRPKV